MDPFQYFTKLSKGSTLLYVTLTQQRKEQMRAQEVLMKIIGWQDSEG